MKCNLIKCDKVEVDGVHLHQAGQHVPLFGDQVADVDQGLLDPPVEGGLDLRVAEIDLLCEVLGMCVVVLSLV